jgi:hypothetical protein
MLLDLRPSNVRFGYDPARGFNLGLVRPAAWRGDTGALRDGWAEVVVGSHLPVPLERCHREGSALLAHGPLRGTGDLTVRDGRLEYVRRSCCLYYRLGGRGGSEPGRINTDGVMTRAVRPGQPDG